MAPEPPSWPNRSGATSVRNPHKTRKRGARRACDSILRPGVDHGSFIQDAIEGIANPKGALACQRDRTNRSPTVRHWQAYRKAQILPACSRTSVELGTFWRAPGVSPSSIDNHPSVARPSSLGRPVPWAVARTVPATDLRVETGDFTDHGPKPSCRRLRNRTES